MTRLGFILGNADIVDVREKGSVTVLTVVSSAPTKRSAKRGARAEASTIIPITQQNFIKESKNEKSYFRDVWRFNISDDGDVDA